MSRLLLMPLAVLLLAAAAAGVPQIGQPTSDQPCPAECTKILLHVCGSNDRTYNNECILKMASCKNQLAGFVPITVQHQGKCAPSPVDRACAESCPNDYVPVCGSDGVTYWNSCRLTCVSGIRQLRTGTCSSGTSTSSSQAAPATAGSRPRPLPGSIRPNCRKDCTDPFRPVCGSNDITYASQCLLDNAKCNDPSVFKKNEGACSKDCSMVCNDEVVRLCGTDGNTYRNSCYMIVANCRDPSVRFKHEGYCEPVKCDADAKCPDTYDPICGSDGVTYQNLCYFNREVCRSNSGLLNFGNKECV